jgi:hypothetical protein
MTAVRAFVFLGAFLLFTMEPMVGRMLLPHFGGAFHVWTTSLMFFQGVLFLAYAYAHLLAERLGKLHFAVIALAVIGLPRAVEITGEHDVPALLLALAQASALPFAALATTSVVAQHWVHRSNLPDRENPYWLYGTSNVGSMLSLIVYALLIEPFIGVSVQRQVFAGAFVLWIIAGVMAYRATRATGAGTGTGSGSGAESGDDETIGAGRMIYWLLLSACPSALLMGVTNVIALDAGNVPLVWIVPLALYLLTFVLAFDDPDHLPQPLHRAWAAIRSVLPARFELPERCPIPLPAQLRDEWSHLRETSRVEVPERVPLRRVPDWVRRLWPLFGAVGFYAAIGGSLPGEQLQVLLHLMVFLVLALGAHAELYESRPHARRLTLFYLLLSLGGWLGGAFVAVIAPRIFVRLLEYPIAIVVLTLAVLVYRWRDFREWLRGAGILPIGLGVALIFVMVFQYGRFVLGDHDDARELTRARSFYGIYLVIERPTEIGPLRDLISGVTRHGRQFMDPPHREEPLSYYHRDGSLGEVMTVLRARAEAEHRPLNIAAIGLGVGAAAAYLEPDDHMTFFEIDALDDQLARRYFHYLEDCRGHVETVIGDARVTLEEQAASENPPSFDLVLVDAFSGDAIPTHLVTREATELYFDLVRARNGWVLFHVSNRYYNLRPVLAGIARALDRPGAWRRRMRPTGLGEDPSEYVVFPPSEEDLASFDENGWTRFSAGGLQEVDLWTDDRTNTLAILQIDLR